MATDQVKQVGILIEGPDKCGKTTFAKAYAKRNNLEYKRLPEQPIRDLVFGTEFKGSAQSMLFFAGAAQVWNDASTDFVLDRDIASMIVYQSLLMEHIDHRLAVNMYKAMIYKHTMPKKIIYVVNPPFVDYGNDHFEAFGYDKIRQAYDLAIEWIGLNFPIEIERVFIERETDDFA